MPCIWNESPTQYTISCMFGSSCAHTYLSVFDHLLSKYSRFSFSFFCFVCALAEFFCPLILCSCQFIDCTLVICIFNRFVIVIFIQYIESLTIICLTGHNQHEHMVAFLSTCKSGLIGIYIYLIIWGLFLSYRSYKGYNFCFFFFFRRFGWWDTCCMPSL